MKKPTTRSIDGFVPRRHSGSEERQVGPSGLRRLDQSAAPIGRTRQTRQSGKEGLSRQDIDESLSSIDSSEQPQAKKRRLPKKFVKKVIIGLIVLLLLVGAFVGIKAFIAGSSIFQGNLLGLIYSQPLKEDEHGRSNIVLFGTSEDDQGGDHPGAYLTDSIMVISIDQDEKDAYMFSIPRDLWVTYDTTCLAGTEGKINQVFACHSNNGENEKAGSNALRKKISEVTGLDVQYYAHVNYSVVRDAVDAVGGVEIVIESDDPRGILDRNFDWKCNYECYYVKYDNGPTGIMDGEHALALARARGSVAPTYGLEQGNFDREANQQKILKALKDKAVSAGTIANIGKVTSLIDAFGQNLRTNFETSEIRTLMDLSTDIATDEIKSISLLGEDKSVVTIDSYSGQSIVRPTSGLYDYSSIKSYLYKHLNGDAAALENANIGVYNGTNQAGKAQEIADNLTAKGLTVTDIGNAPDGDYQSYEIYMIDETKTATKQKLEELYGVNAKTTQPPVEAFGLDVVIIVGRQSSAN